MVSLRYVFTSILGMFAIVGLCWASNIAYNESLVKVSPPACYACVVKPLVANSTSP